MIDGEFVEWTGDWLERRTVAVDLGFKPWMTWVDSQGYYGHQDNARPYLSILGENYPLRQQLETLLRLHLGQPVSLPRDGDVRHLFVDIPQAKPILHELERLEQHRSQVRYSMIAQAAEFLLAYELVILERMDMPPLMAQPAKACAIRDSGWFEFWDLMRAEAPIRGVDVRYVDQSFTSLTCPRCYGQHPGNRPKGSARFKCVRCGHSMDVNVVAALNLLRRGVRQDLSPGWP